MKAVSSLSAVTALDPGVVKMVWTNPAADAFAPDSFVGIRILRRAHAYPENPDDGTVLYDGPPIAQFEDRTSVETGMRYYRVFARDNGGGFHDDARASTTTGFAANHSGFAETIYGLLPAIHQRHDQPYSEAERALFNPAQQAALDALPPELADSGPLHRFILSLFRPFDVVRAAAEILPSLRNADQAHPDALRMMAESLGWHLDEMLPLARQRTDVRFAPRFLRSNGSVEGIARLVRRTTGWRVDLVERHAQILRTNRPARRAVASLIERSGTWHAAEDIAPLLGLADIDALGAPGAPAVLAGSVPGPYQLPPGGSLRFEIGAEAPIRIHIRPADVADINTTTASEIAGILNRNASEIIASATLDGRLEVATAEVGTGARLRVVRDRRTFLFADTAPTGRPATVTAGPDDARVIFYETFDPSDDLTLRLARDRLTGRVPPFANLPFAPATAATGPQTPTLPLSPRSDIRMSVNRNGHWLGSLSLDLGMSPVANPATSRLTDGSILLGWIENPNTAQARVRVRRAILGAATPAVLDLGFPGPWSLPAGSRLRLRITRSSGAPIETGIAFAPSNFADAEAVTQAELAALLSLRLSGVTAIPRPDGGLQLQSDGIGAEASITVDLAPGASTAAEALGIAPVGATAVGNDGLPLTYSEIPQPTLPTGWTKDLFLTEDGAGGAYLFAIQSQGGGTLFATRLSGGLWGSTEVLAENAASPAARMASDGRVHLFYAQRDPAAPGEHRWSLRRRRFVPAGPAWDAEQAITTQPVGGRAADLDPAPGPDTAGTIDLLLSSDRAGGRSLHRLAVPLAAAPAGDPIAILPSTSEETAPVAITHADGTLELIHRTDASPTPVRLPQNAGSSISGVREDELGLVPAPSGTTTVDLSNTARLGLQGLKDDTLAYTPQRPIGPLGKTHQDGGPPIVEPALSPNEQLSRETTTAYIRRAASSAPLTAERQTRLAGMMDRLSPINLRLALALVPERTVEEIYPDGADIEERWEDRGPFVENFGAITDRTEAASPLLRILTTNTIDHVTADPTDLASLRNRLFFPPLE